MSKRYKVKRKVEDRSLRFLIVVDIPVELFQLLDCRMKLLLVSYQFDNIFSLDSL